MNSHLISKVVLKKFSVNNKVAVHDKSSDALIDLRVIDSIACIEQDADILGDLEKKWCNEIETHMPKIYNSLELGYLLDRPTHIKIIKRLLVLHFIRSSVFYKIYSEKTVQMVDEFTARVKAQAPEESKNQDEQIRSYGERELAIFLPVILQDQIAKIEEDIQPHGIEIGIASEGFEFVIGDNPVITATTDGKVGILNGVPFKSSIAFGMPLTPKHLVTLKSKDISNRYVTLSGTQVEAANRKQKIAATEVYLSRPKSS